MLKKAAGKTAKEAFLMKKGKILIVGLIALLMAGVLVLAGCDNDPQDNNNGSKNNSNNTGNSGGYSWSNWYAITLPSGTSAAQFILDDEAPHALEIQVQNATPASFTLSSYGSKHATTSQPGATLQYRHRLSGFGIKSSTISGPVVRFEYLGEFAAY
jgi:hypothetical protein